MLSRASLVIGPEKTKRTTPYWSRNQVVGKPPLHGKTQKARQTRSLAITASSPSTGPTRRPYTRAQPRPATLLIARFHAYGHEYREGYIPALLKPPAIGKKLPVVNML